MGDGIAVKREGKEGRGNLRVGPKWVSRSSQWARYSVAVSR